MPIQSLQRELRGSKIMSNSTSQNLADPHAGKQRLGRLGRLQATYKGSMEIKHRRK